MEPLFYAIAGAGVVLLLLALRHRYASFSGQSPEDYKGQTPQFDIRHHLNGPIRCEGVIYGPLGRVTSRFEADFEAEWQGNTGVMREHFHYDSGNTQDREWCLRIGNDGRIEAEAEDLVGTGEGWQSGSAVQLKYRIRLPDSAGGHVLDTTDWMYLTPGGAIVNRSQFRKFGIQVAELVATMRPANAPVAGE